MERITEFKARLVYLEPREAHIQILLGTFAGLDMRYLKSLRTAGREISVFIYVCVDRSVFYKAEVLHLCCTRSDILNS